MTRVRLYFVGSLALVALAGCGRSLFNIAQREPWRHDAEVACLKSGAVREGAGVVRIEPIEGPGICGADFPLKVAALGASNAIAFADEFQPPAAIPNDRRDVPHWPAGQAAPAAQLRWQMGPQPVSGLPPPSPADVAAAATPLAIHPAEREPAGASEESEFQRPSITPARPFYRQPPPESGVTLGPPRAPLIAAVGPVAVKPAATLACPIVSALDHWIATAVQPAALHWFGQPVVAIRQISAYSCRGMNGNPHAHISEHAFGNALDIAAFTFADGRQVSVQHGWHGTPQEQGFLHDVQGAACDDFTTVLSPGYNIYHYNHIHVDLMRRRRHVCRPAAIPGEVAAARAAQKYAHRGDPGITGSISSSKHSPKHSIRELIDDEDSLDEDGSSGRLN